MYVARAAGCGSKFARSGGRTRDHRYGILRCNHSIAKRDAVFAVGAAYKTQLFPFGSRFIQNQIRDPMTKMTYLRDLPEIGQAKKIKRPGSLVLGGEYVCVCV